MLDNSTPSSIYHDTAQGAITVRDVLLGDVFGMDVSPSLLDGSCVLACPFYQKVKTEKSQYQQSMTDETLDLMKTNERYKILSLWFSLSDMNFDMTM